MQIRCGECKKALSLADEVVMNQMNCLTHKECYLHAPSFVIDAGTYKYMIEKYWFFQLQNH
ncbi:hypothetical protein AZ46_0220355 [Metabacillus indicus LMG 22858]|nr:hypothetical protein AZ46_0220355 [Metabacillus indicus LMG 22858]